MVYAAIRPAFFYCNKRLTNFSWRRWWQQFHAFWSYSTESTFTDHYADARSLFVSYISVKF